jgi:putative membrane protein
MTEKEFNESLIGPVQFSLATSRIAVDKATNEKVKEFATFELAEAVAVTKVLTDLGIVIPVTDENTKAEFTEIESAEKGIAFDKQYMKSQVTNHKLLRDLTEEYLKEAPSENLDKEEAEEKHLAILLLTIFNQHIAIAEKIAGELNNGEPQ